MNNQQPATPLMTVKTTARRLELSEQRVRQLANEGRLAHMRTDTGVRLFAADDVQRFADSRPRR